MNLSNPDCVFARDLVLFVMKFHRPSWHFSDEFAIETDKTHFTENFANYIQTFIQENNVGIQKDYEEAFKGIELNEELFRSVGKNLMVEFFGSDDDFDVIKFLAYCGILTKYTVLSYIFGQSTAPYYAVVIILDTLKYLRSTGKFTDESWSDIERYINCK